jgi:tetratricopeptide (TPR) repeat protein
MRVLMEEELLPNDVSQILNVGAAAVERGDYAGALPMFNSLYRKVRPDKYPFGLSFWGLCLVHVERKYKQGADLCDQAIALQNYEGRHWANLVRVYILGKNRRKAVEVLERGLRKLRNDPALLQVREEIGYREAPTLSFLKRQNPINKFFSRTLGKLQRRGKFIAIAIGVLLYLAVSAAIFLAIVD